MNKEELVQEIAKKSSVTQKEFKKQFLKVKKLL